MHAAATDRVDASATAQPPSVLKSSSLSTPTAVEMIGVNKWFGKFHVLCDISLKVSRGEKIVICGPSGSGKSTMIRCINRLEEHQKGQIIVDGAELTNDLKKTYEIRRDVGMVFQHFNLFPSCSSRRCIPALLAGALCAAVPAGLDIAAPARAQASEWAGKKLVVGIHNRTPWGYRDKHNNVVGIHPDIVRAVFAPLGVTEFEFVVSDFGAMIPGLLAGRFDIIASGVAITPARCEQVLFSEPDVAVGDSLLVLKGNPLKLHSYDGHREESDRCGSPAGAARRTPRTRWPPAFRRARFRCFRTTRPPSARSSPDAPMPRRFRRRAPSASSRSRRWKASSARCRSRG